MLCSRLLELLRKDDLLKRVAQYCTADNPNGFFALRRGPVRVQCLPLGSWLQSAERLSRSLAGLIDALLQFPEGIDFLMQSNILTSIARALQAELARTVLHSTGGNTLTHHRPAMTACLGRCE